MLQPRNRSIFGGLKATARHLFVRRSHQERHLKIGKPEVVQVFIEPWLKLSESRLEGSWLIYNSGPRIQNHHSALTKDVLNKMI
jgi:hypothetical protein